MADEESPVTGMRVHVPTVMKHAVAKYQRIVEELVRENAELTTVVQTLLAERDDLRSRVTALQGSNAP